ncbi:Cytochrome P450 [Trichophyton rubrum]|nr:Cytochrome P450 [Trichophyton rubrum]
MLKFHSPSYTTLWFTAILGAAALLLYLVGTLVYLVLFHPLAKYPGPWLAKITNLYAGYHSWKGDLHIDMLNSHDKYGKFVRYGPNSLLVNTVDGLHGEYIRSRKTIQKGPEIWSYGAPCP